MNALPSNPLLKLAAGLSDLRVAILLLLVIATSSGVGTAIPQGEPASFYLARYDPQPWLGIFKGQAVLWLQLDHLYTSQWFLFLLAWLGLAGPGLGWSRQSRQRGRQQLRIPRQPRGRSPG